MTCMFRTAYTTVTEYEPVVSAIAIKETNIHYYINLHTCRAYVDTRNSVITSHQCRWIFGAVRSRRRRLGIVNIPETDER